MEPGGEAGNPGLWKSRLPPSPPAPIPLPKHRRGDLTRPSEQVGAQSPRARQPMTPKPNFVIKSFIRLQWLVENVSIPEFSCVMVTLQPDFQPTIPLKLP